MSLYELENLWSLGDVLDAHDVLDEYEATLEEQQRARRGSR